MKDLRANVVVVDYNAAMAEARSLNVIRTALENLEDQLELFHVSSFLPIFLPCRIRFLVLFKKE